MSGESPSQLLIVLGSLRNNCGKGHYQRVKLADQLLKDKVWVESIGGLDKTITLLEEDYFADLCGNVGLCQLLDLFYNFPKEEVWLKNKYNFRKMWADWKAKTEPTKTKTKKAPSQRGIRNKTFPSPIEFNNLTPSEQKKFYERVLSREEVLEEENKTLREENKTLREENRALELENARLRTELHSLKTKLKTLVA